MMQFALEFLPSFLSLSHHQTLNEDQELFSRFLWGKAHKITDWVGFNILETLRYLPFDEAI